jgi:hypothetical protein
MRSSRQKYRWWHEEHFDEATILGSLLLKRIQLLGNASCDFLLILGQVRIAEHVINKIYGLLLELHVLAEIEAVLVDPVAQDVQNAHASRRVGNHEVVLGLLEVNGRTCAVYSVHSVRDVEGTLQVCVQRVAHLRYVGRWRRRGRVSSSH